MRSKANVVSRDWGEDCRTWELLSRGDLAVFHEQMPPGTAEKEHYHARARQFFFVLEGELLLEILGVAHRLRRHEGLEVPPGERHVVRNVSDHPAEFLAIAHPSTLNDRHVGAT